MRLIRATGRVFRSGDRRYLAIVLVGYLAATALAIWTFHPVVDRMMVLAERLAQGRVDSPTFATTVDSVTIDGRTYLAVGPLQVLPYLPFVPVPALQGLARYIMALVPGLLAAWLALPLARAYGASGSAAYWIAGFTAFGTLLFYVSVFGDFYYLAHAEAFLALTVLLLEWAGRRRPLVIGLAFAFAFLARPPTILAAVPFGVALLLDRPRRLSSAVAFAAPLAVGLAVYGGYNWARFGSPFEAGYAISHITEPTLIARRALGVFSPAQIPENIRLALFQGFTLRVRPPFLIPDPHGLSMLLVSPGLLIALRAGFRRPLARLLWIATGLVAIPILLFYGGGYVQYGFRYSLDFTPFLIALIALGTTGRFGRLERALIAVSVASVTWGILWHARV
jgi:hypothetical protein